METEIKVKKKVDITKEDFNDYVDVQMSGVTNMFNVSYVCELSGLSREKVFAIIENYESLDKEFNNLN